MNFLLALCIAYLIGALPLHYWIGGKKTPFSLSNIKALWNQGVLYLVFIDMFKGIIATFIALVLSGWMAAYLAAILVVIGSIYSIFLGFKGGNGIAVAAGALFVLSPLLIVLGTIIYIVSILTTRYLFISNLFTILCVIVLSFLFASQFYVWLVTFCIGLIIIYRQKPDWKKIKKIWETPYRFKNPFR